MKYLWKIITITIPFVIISLVVLQYVISNELAGAGALLVNYADESNKYSEENKLLQQQLSIARSLAIIEKTAISLGYVKTVSYLQFSTEQPVALR